MNNAYYKIMAEYNEWMNTRLYSLCAALSDDELQQDRGAFFKSIYLTLNHITYGDLAFMSRFTGDPVAVPELDKALFPSFSILHKNRKSLDIRIIDWSCSLTESWLAEPLTYQSKVDGKYRTVQKWILVTQMFNHQTHHRGQVTTLLSQIGLDMGSTDIPFMPQFQSNAG
ncbi:MAG: DinB family protein [Methylococcaceae bacterium]|jgi:uncharacterized damage-inducible protein DinB